MKNKFKVLCIIVTTLVIAGFLPLSAIILPLCGIVMFVCSQNLIKEVRSRRYADGHVHLEE